MDAVDESNQLQETPKDEVMSFFESAPLLKDAAEIAKSLKEFVDRNTSSSGNCDFIIYQHLIDFNLFIEYRCHLTLFFVSMFSDRKSKQGGVHYFRWYNCSFGKTMCSSYRQL